MSDNKNNDLIPSFQVDHTNLKPGIYESRVDMVGDSFVTTYDIRMKRPNREPVIHSNAMHTIEHIIATFLRNNQKWKDEVIYWGPMGCLTGCYLILKGRYKTKDLIPLMKEAFTYLAEYDDEIPGATAKECGNYIFQDLNMAKYEALKYLEVLNNNPGLEYPTL